MLTICHARLLLVMLVNGLQQQQHMGMAAAGFAGSNPGQWPMGQIPAHAGPGGGLGPMGQPLHGLGQAPAAGLAHGPGGFGSLSGGQHGAAGGPGLIKGGSLGGSGPGTSNGGVAWSGHDDVSNLMRQVAHGGKYDPAFDFVADEFKAGKH